MIDPASQTLLKEAIDDCIYTDRSILNTLRDEIRPLKKPYSPNSTAFNNVDLPGRNRWRKQSTPVRPFSDPTRSCR